MTKSKKIILRKHSLIQKYDQTKNTKIKLVLMGAGNGSFRS